MKLFNLLAMGMVVCAGVNAQAQTVFQQDFSAEQTAQATDPGYYEFINLQEGDKWGINEAALLMENSDQFPCTNQTWQRGIKFRNLPIKEKTLYKMSFDINPMDTPVDAETFTNVPGYVDVKLQQGGENADICILGADGSEQRANVTLTKGEAQNISKLFYFADKAAQDAKYEEKKSSEAYVPGLEDKYFVSVNVYAPGKYSVDNFVLEEASPIEKIEFNGFNIRMGYAGAINASALLNGATRKVYDKSFATVKVNGTPVEVDDVEIQKDGLYIFLMDEVKPSDVVEVTLNAPEEVQMTGAFAGLSLNCEGVKAQFSEDATLAAAMPFSFAPAEIVKSTPAEGSFALPTTIDKFVVEFDHEIDPAGIVAEVSNGKTLAVTSVEGKVVTLAGGEFPKGAYTITLKNIKNAGTGTPTEVDPTISFETGEIKLASIDYTKVAEDLPIADANVIPEGWTVYSDGEERAGGSSYGSGGRTFDCAAKTGKGIYTRANGGEGSVLSAGVQLPAAGTPVELRCLLGYWSNPSNVKIQVLDQADGVIAEKEYSTTVPAEATRNNSGFAFEEVPFRFDSNGGVVKVKYTLLTEGFNGMFVGGQQIYTYVETPGDKFEPEVVFDSQFTGAKMPAEGSGWLVYENNNPLTPGSDRNGTSGILEKNFHQKMQSAAFFRECGTNDQAAMRLEYGNGNGVDKGFHMEPGKYELTYYAGTWNDNAGNAAGTSKVFMDLIDAATGSVIFHSEHVNVANFGNGGACNGQADKITEKVATAGGDFIVRLWGTTNTVLGSLSIVKEGSLAAKWYSKLAEAVEEAKTELSASEAENLNGTAKIALSDAIGKYEKPAGMYTEAEFQGAIDELAKAQADMKDRREAMSTYQSVIGNIASTVEGADDKFKQLDSYKVLADLNEKYGKTDPVTLENEELVPLANSLKANYDIYTFMSTTGVDLVTKQIKSLKTAILNMAGNEKYADILAQADMAVSDDQDIANLLKLVYTQLLYTACAGETDPFIEIDPDLLTETPAPKEAVGFIANSEFYCNKPAINGNLAVEPENFPMWDITVKKGPITSSFNVGWDASFPTEQAPIRNCAVKTTWGDYEYDVKQLLTNLPVALYNFSIQIGEDGNAGDEANPGHGCYAFCGEDQQAYKGHAEVDDQGNPKDPSYSRDFNQEEHTKLFEKVKPVVAEGEVLGTMNIGAHMSFRGGFGNVDNAKLQIVGKMPGFDYAKAAAALDEMITGVENVEGVVAKAKNAVAKFVKGGQVLIEKAGKIFNAAGAQVK